MCESGELKADCLCYVWTRPPARLTDKESQALMKYPHPHRHHHHHHHHQKKLVLKWETQRDVIRSERLSLVIRLSEKVYSSPEEHKKNMLYDKKKYLC